MISLQTFSLNSFTNFTPDRKMEASANSSLSFVGGNQPSLLRVDITIANVLHELIQWHAF